MVTLIQFGANVIRQCVSTQPFHWFMQDHAAFWGMQIFHFWLAHKTSHSFFFIFYIIVMSFTFNFFYIVRKKKLELK
jgi:hypothetical protein